MKIGRPTGDNYKLVLASLQPCQRRFIEVLSTCSEDDLMIHLRSFTQWVWERSDIICWASVLNRFDDIFAHYLDVTQNYLKGESDIDPTSFFREVELVKSSLKASTMIVENCTSKSIYNSLDHLIKLMDDMNLEIVYHSTRLLCVYFSTRNRRNSVLKEIPYITSRLSTYVSSPLPDRDFKILASNQTQYTKVFNQVAYNEFFLSCPLILEYYLKCYQYWLSKDSYIELDMYNKNREHPDKQFKIPIHEILNIEQVSHIQKNTQNVNYNSNEKYNILLNEFILSISENQMYFHLLKTFKYIVKKYDIDESLHQTLRYKMLKIYSLYFVQLQRLLVNTRLSSLICMLFINISSYTQFLTYNPCFLLELSWFIKCHEHIDHLTMIISTELLSAMIYDGINYKSLASLLGFAVPHGIFIKVLKSYLHHPHESQPLPPVLKLKDDSSLIDPDQYKMKEDYTNKNEKELCELQSQGYYWDENTESTNWSILVNNKETLNQIILDEERMRVLLQLLIVYYSIITYHANCSALTGVNVLESLVKFIRIRNPIYTPVVIYVVQVLEALLDYNQTVSRVLRSELHLYHFFLSRLQYDICKIENFAHFGNNYSNSNLWPEGWLVPNSNNENILRVYWLTFSESGARKFLFKTVVKDIYSVTRAFSGRNEINDYDVFAPTSPIVPIVLKILENPLSYGHGIYSSVISLVLDTIGDDPISQEEMHEMGIIPSFLTSVNEDTLKSEDCLNLVPSAICDMFLHRSGQEFFRTMKYSFVLKLIDIITKREFVLFDRFGEVAASIGLTLDNVVRHHENSHHLIVKRLIKVIYELLQEAMEFPAFRKVKTTTATSETEEAIKDLKTNSPAITLDTLSQLDNLKPSDFYADRISNLGKCLSSFLSYAQSVSYFISCDGIKLLMQLCMVKCLPPMFIHVYPQHPLVLIIKYLTSQAPLPSIIHFHTITQYYLNPYSNGNRSSDLNNLSVDYLNSTFNGFSSETFEIAREENTHNRDETFNKHNDRTTETSQTYNKSNGHFNTERDSMRGTLLFLNMMHKDNATLYNEGCCGKYQIGMELLSTCELHETITMALNMLNVELPKLMFGIASSISSPVTSKLVNSYLSHEHPELRAYKEFMSDKKNSQNDLVLSANDFFWSSQCHYAYSNVVTDTSSDPESLSVKNKDDTGDIMVLIVEMDRLTVTVAKSLIFALNSSVNKALKFSSNGNECLKSHLSKHSHQLVSLCLNLLENVNNVVNDDNNQFTSSVKYLPSSIKHFRNVKFASDSLELLYKLIVDDRTNGLYLLSTCLFSSKGGTELVSSCLDYLFNVLFGVIFTMANRQNLELSLEDLVGPRVDLSSFPSFEKMLDDFVDCDMQALKATYNNVVKALQIGLTFFSKCTNPRTLLNTDMDQNLTSFLTYSLGQQSDNNVYQKVEEDKMDTNEINQQGDTQTQQRDNDNNDATTTDLVQPTEDDETSRLVLGPKFKGRKTKNKNTTGTNRYQKNDKVTQLGFRGYGQTNLEKTHVGHVFTRMMVTFVQTSWKWFSFISNMEPIAPASSTASPFFYLPSKLVTFLLKVHIYVLDYLSPSRQQALNLHFVDLQPPSMIASRFDELSNNLATNGSVPRMFRRRRTRTTNTSDPDPTENRDVDTNNIDSVRSYLSEMGFNDRDINNAITQCGNSDITELTLWLINAGEFTPENLDRTDLVQPTEDDDPNKMILDHLKRSQLFHLSSLSESVDDKVELDPVESDSRGVQVDNTSSSTSSSSNSEERENNNTITEVDMDAEVTSSNDTETKNYNQLRDSIQQIESCIKSQIVEYILKLCLHMTTFLSTGYDSLYKLHSFKIKFFLPSENLNLKSLERNTSPQMSGLNDSVGSVDPDSRSVQVDSSSKNKNLRRFTANDPFRTYSGDDLDFNLFNLMSYIVGQISSIYKDLQSRSLDVKNENLMSLFCPVIFIDDTEKQAALDQVLDKFVSDRVSVIRASFRRARAKGSDTNNDREDNRDKMNEDQKQTQQRDNDDNQNYNNNMSLNHQKLMSLFYLLSHLMAGKENFTNTALKVRDENRGCNMLQVVLEVVEYFLNLRSRCFAKGVLTMNSLGMKKKFGLPLQVPEWCLAGECDSWLVKRDSSNKFEFSQLKYGINVSGCTPQVSSPPPFFKYALICLHELVKVSVIDGFMAYYTHLPKTHSFSLTKRESFKYNKSEKEYFGLPKSETSYIVKPDKEKDSPVSQFRESPNKYDKYKESPGKLYKDTLKQYRESEIPDVVQERLLYGCMKVLEMFPGLDGDVTFSVLSILDNLTEVYKNAEKLTKYKCMNSRSNMDFLRLLLTIPKSGLCIGALRMVSNILLHVMEDYSLVKPALRNKIIDLLRLGPISIGTFIDEIYPFSKKCPLLLFQMVETLCVITVDEALYPEPEDVEMNDDNDNTEEAEKNNTEKERIKEENTHNRDTTLTQQTNQHEPSTSNGHQQLSKSASQELSLPTFQKEQSTNYNLKDLSITLKNWVLLKDQVSVEGIDFNTSDVDDFKVDQKKSYQILRTIVEYLHMCCNLQGMTDMSKNDGKAKLHYPFCFNVSSLFFFLNVLNHNFPLPLLYPELVNNMSGTPGELHIKPFPHKLDRLDKYNVRSLLLFVTRNIFSMICCLVSPKNLIYHMMNSGVEITQSELEQVQKSILESLENYSNTLMIFSTHSPEVSACVIEELSEILGFVASVNQKDSGPYLLPIAVYTLCNLLDNLLQLRFNKFVDIYQVLVSLKKSLCTILAKLDLFRLETRVVCGSVTRVLVLLTNSTNSSYPQPVSEKINEDSTVLVELEEETITDESVSDQMDMDDEHPDDYEDDDEGEEEDVEIDYTDELEQEDEEGEFSEDGEQGEEGEMIIDVTTTETSLSSESENEMDLPEEEEQDEQEDITLPHEMDEDYQSVHYSDSISTSSIEDVEEEEEGPRIRVAGEIDEITRVGNSQIIDTTTNISIPEDNESDYSESREEVECENEDHISDTIVQVNNSNYTNHRNTVRQTDPNQTIQIEIQFSNQNNQRNTNSTGTNTRYINSSGTSPGWRSELTSNTFGTSSGYVPRFMNLRTNAASNSRLAGTWVERTRTQLTNPSRQYRQQATDTQNNENRVRSDTWSNTGDLDVFIKNPLLPNFKKTTAEQTPDPLIHFLVKKLQIYKVKYTEAEDVEMDGFQEQKKLSDGSNLGKKMDYERWEHGNVTTNMDCAHSLNNLNNTNQQQQEQNTHNRDTTQTQQTNNDVEIVDEDSIRPTGSEVVVDTSVQGFPGSDTSGPEINLSNTEDNRMVTENPENTREVNTAPDTEMMDLDSEGRYYHRGLDIIANALGLSYNELFSLANMDPGVIAELPSDMREEIISQQLHTINVEAVSSLRESRPPRPNSFPGVTPSRSELQYLESLPRSLRLDVTRTIYGENSAEANEINATIDLEGDNTSLVAALGPLYRGDGLNTVSDILSNLVTGLESGDQALNIVTSDDNIYPIPRQSPPRTRNPQAWQMRMHRQNQSRTNPSSGSASNNSINPLSRQGISQYINVLNDLVAYEQIRQVSNRVRGSRNDTSDPRNALTLGFIIGEVREQNSLRRLTRPRSTNIRRLSNNLNRRNETRDVFLWSGRGLRMSRFNDTSNQMSHAGSESMDIDDRHSNIDSRILNSIPTIINSFDPNLLEVLQHGQPAGDIQEQVDMNSDRVLEDVVKLIPKSPCSPNLILLNKSTSNNSNKDNKNSGNKDSANQNMLNDTTNSDFSQTLLGHALLTRILNSNENNQNNNQSVSTNMDCAHSLNNLNNTNQQQQEQNTHNRDTTLTQQTNQHEPSTSNGQKAEDKQEQVVTNQTETSYNLLGGGCGGEMDLNGLVGVCRMFFLPNEINKKAFFKLLYNISAGPSQPDLIKMFLFMLKESILNVGVEYECDDIDESFFGSCQPMFSQLRSLRNSSSNILSQFPSFKNSNNTQTSLKSKNNRNLVDQTDRQQQLSNSIVQVFEHPLRTDYENVSYMCSERVLEQLRSLLIALPHIISSFSKPLIHMDDPSAQELKRKKKRTETSFTFHPIDFFFFATATNLFQSSTKHMNHLLMVIHSLLGYKSEDNMNDLDSEIVGNLVNKSKLDSSIDSNLSAQIVNSLSPQALSVFLKIYTSFKCQSTWLQFSNTKDTNAQSQMEVISGFLAVLYKGKHKEFITNFMREKFQLVTNLLVEALRKITDTSLKVEYQMEPLMYTLLRMTHLISGTVKQALKKNTDIETDSEKKKDKENDNRDSEERDTTQTQQTNQHEPSTSTGHQQQYLDSEDTDEDESEAQSSFNEEHLEVLNNFFTTLSLEALWHTLDESLVYLTERSMVKNFVGDFYTETHIENYSYFDVVRTLIPLIEVFLTTSQLLVAFEYNVPDFKFCRVLSHINYDTSALSTERREAYGVNLSSPRLDSVRSYSGDLLQHSDSLTTSRDWSKHFKDDDDEVVYDISPSHIMLLNFVDKHKRLLNLFVKQTPWLLHNTFSPLVRLTPMCISFEIKRHYFRQKLREGKPQHRTESIKINVRRQHVFLDSYHQLRLKTTEEMKSRLVVSFGGEEGVDAGGLTREWYTILSKEIFNPNYALFTREGRKQEFNHPNPLSAINPDHLNYFKFIGRVIGKALYDGGHMEAYFCRSFYKHMLGTRITPSDAESVDPQFYNNLISIRNSKLEDLGLELYFSTEIDEFGKVKVIDLIPNGRNILVTDENKHKYIQLICRHKVTNGIREQLDAFMEGFRELIPPEHISIFDDRELELLISGVPTIDLNDMRQNVEYENYSESSDQIKWLWEILGEFDQSHLAAFLQFVTGTSRVPIGGFKNLIGMRGPQKISIHRTFGQDRLPTAHTCFNQLDLPVYDTKEMLRSKLLQAILEGKEGFGFI